MPKPRKPKTAKLTRHALRTLSMHGISYKQSHGGIGRTTRTTILGRVRAPKNLIPKARFNLRLTY